jgi:DNA polymerase IV
VKFEDFMQITRSKSFPESLNNAVIAECATDLAMQLQLMNKGVRLLGLTVSNQQEEEDSSAQLSLEF